MPDGFDRSSKVAGGKQVCRAIKSGKAQIVWLAADAAPGVIAPIAALCEKMGVPTENTYSMEELGRICGIAVGAATAALVAS